jgi:hypothetical protein
MTEPVKASHVARKPLSEDERRRVTAAQVVKARMARSNALRSIGALPPSSDTLAGDLERSLRRRTGLQ